MIKISDFCDIFIGLNINRLKNEINSLSQNSNIDYYVLRTNDNSILFNEIEKPKLIKNSFEKINDNKMFVRKGDILLKLIYPIKFIYVNCESVFLVPSMYCIIRVNNKSKFDSMTLWAYLNSNYVKKHVYSKIQGNSNSISIKINDIKNMEINQNIIKKVNSNLFYKIHLYSQLQNKKINLLMDIINKY